MKKLSAYLNYLIAAVVVGYAIFFFLDSKKINLFRNVASLSPEKKPINVDEVVNKYITETSNKILKDQVDSQIALRHQLSQPVIIQKPKTIEINPEDIPVEQQIWKDSRLNQMSADSKKSVQKISEDRQEELDKKEFARQYIENARKDGYHVELSSDLKVLSVTPIRKPSQQDSLESFPSQ